MTFLIFSWFHLIIIELNTFLFWPCFFWPHLPSFHRARHNAFWDCLKCERNKQCCLRVWRTQLPFGTAVMLEEHLWSLRMRLTRLCTLFLSLPCEWSAVVCSREIQSLGPWEEMNAVLYLYSLCLTQSNLPTIIVRIKYLSLSTSLKMTATSLVQGVWKGVISLLPSAVRLWVCFTQLCVCVCVCVWHLSLSPLYACETSAKPLCAQRFLFITLWSSQLWFKYQLCLTFLIKWLWRSMCVWACDGLTIHPGWDAGIGSRIHAAQQAVWRMDGWI